MPDFIAVARALIDRRYTSAARIVAHGGSAGGMLMGAIANRAPELFAGIVAEVPFVDVLNTMLDDSLPLTPPEWPEWGNPIADAGAFRTILAYSPYDNVAAKAYPAILAMGGLTDPRVTYWEPAKWVARLRATMTGLEPSEHDAICEHIVHNDFPEPWSVIETMASRAGLRPVSMTAPQIWHRLMVFVRA